MNVLIVCVSMLGTPIVGDVIYSRQSNKQRVLDEESRTHLMLAAVDLSFNEPSSDKRVDFHVGLHATICCMHSLLILLILD
jgi:23S rRNA-/tRNA-specific pseudouridylate synthase